MKRINNEYFDLLKLWCDSLIEYQITEHKNEAFIGGILCPACMGIHGRIGDAMYPFVFVYSVTGDRKYYDCARLLFKWTMKNMLREKGQIINDAQSVWHYITVFFNISLGELLYNLKAYIDKEDYDEWFGFYLDSSEYIYNSFFDSPSLNINYRVATATSMAIAYRMLGDEKYNAKAREFARISLAHISDEGFIFGEGVPTDGMTAGGYRTVDIGYNAEESLPNLAIYLKYIGKDDEVEKALVEAMRAHLYFMLPDGAWDNSWGSRSNKWSYWGSRTSDGCQPAFVLLRDKDETFFEAAHRSFECFKNCTVDGLLAGGLHHGEMNEPVCVHHTFCHIKALVSLAEADAVTKPVKLPRETLDSIRRFTTMNVAISTKGAWTATYSCDDFSKGNDDDTPSGGAVTLLYHKELGIILGGSPNEFRHAEAHNMQVPRYFEDVCQLARLEYVKDGKKYRNTYDTTASIDCSDNEIDTCYHAEGVLKNCKGCGEFGYETGYTMSEDGFDITVKTEAEGARFILPIVASPDERIEICGRTVKVYKKKGILTIVCSKDIYLDNSRAERIFNMCAGLSTARLFTDICRQEEVIFRFTAE